MISIVRGKIVKFVALPGAALALVVGLGVHPAGASTSQVCGNGGSGYCINDWGGAGRSGDQVNMYYGGTSNDDFYVQAVNRCSGHDTVQSTDWHNATNCPFGNKTWDSDLHGDYIVQVTYTNNSVECVASKGSNVDSFYAVLGVCANPLNGSGGANGVIDVLLPQQGCDFLVNRYWTDASGGPEVSLESSGYVGGPAYFLNPGTCWGGFQFFGP